MQLTDAATKVTDDLKDSAAELARERAALDTAGNVAAEQRHGVVFQPKRHNCRVINLEIDLLEFATQPAASVRQCNLGEIAERSFNARLHQELFGGGVKANALQRQIGSDLHSLRHRVEHMGHRLVEQKVRRDV